MNSIIIAMTLVAQMTNGQITIRQHLSSHDCKEAVCVIAYGENCASATKHQEENDKAAKACEKKYPGQTYLLGPCDGFGDNYNRDLKYINCVK